MNRSRDGFWFFAYRLIKEDERLTRPISSRRILLNVSVICRSTDRSKTATPRPLFSEMDWFSPIIPPEGVWVKAGIVVTSRVIPYSCSISRSNSSGESAPSDGASGSAKVVTVSSVASPSTPVSRYVTTMGGKADKGGSILPEVEPPALLPPLLSLLRDLSPLSPNELLKIIDNPVPVEKKEGAPPRETNDDAAAPAAPLKKFDKVVDVEFSIR